ncbi:unnamed protein product [Rodentolepis nana]|uniref:Period circadian protein n=1 Tax=Rodentolepis nana TaxID=102285 RepID=A0A0R3TTG9_RODNA|nr:unnamed protein product [Rodentolepis nana]
MSLSVHFPVLCRALMEGKDSSHSDDQGGSETSTQTSSPDSHSCNSSSNGSKAPSNEGLTREENFNLERDQVVDLSKGHECGNQVGFSNQQTQPTQQQQPQFASHNPSPGNSNGGVVEEKERNYSSTKSQSGGQLIIQSQQQDSPQFTPTNTTTSSTTNPISGSSISGFSTECQNSATNQPLAHSNGNNGVPVQDTPLDLSTHRKPPLTPKETYSHLING